jgi:3-oxoacyl-[acyl-carrier-protein] synthase-3
MSSYIKFIEYFLPEKLVSNSDLQFEFPDWDLNKIKSKTGVLKRHIAASNETALDLSINACIKLFKYFDVNKIDAIIYCTQSPDYIMPSNSFLIQKEFNFNEEIICYDFNHACSGYIYGLMMADSFIKSGIARSVLLINSDTYSKYINPLDRSTRVLFGDAAAVSVIEGVDSKLGIQDVLVASFGQGYNKFIIPAGGARLPKSEFTSVELTDFVGNSRSQNDINMDGMAVWTFINSKVPGQIRKILKRNNLDINMIDLFVFHQASLMTLKSLIKILNIDENKVFINLENIGNTVSASIPIAIKDAMEAGKFRNNQIVLICGFGVGLSYGTVLLRT